MTINEIIRFGIVLKIMQKFIIRGTKNGKTN